MKKAKFKVGDKLLITTHDTSFVKGTNVEVFRVLTLRASIIYDVCNKKSGDCGYAREEDLAYKTVKIKQTNMQLMKQAVKSTATRMAKANAMVTPLEVKIELRNTHPYFHWIMQSKNGLIGVINYMQELVDDGVLGYQDGDYYIPIVIKKLVAKKAGAKRQTPKINRTTALELMKNNKGHFFTAVFTKKNGEERTINCQYLPDQSTSALGYVRVRETGKLKMGENPIRQINLQTLSNLRIGGQNYTIK